VRFRFYRIKACSTVEKLDTSYALFTASPDSDYDPKNGTVYLPRPGRYSLYTDGALLDTTFDIHDTGLFVFRYKEPDHGLILTGALDTHPLYASCDSILNGNREFHFPGGGIDMRGTFKQGYILDSAAFYYRNGEPRKKVVAVPKMVLVTLFDSLGNRVSVKRTENKSFMVYNQYELQEYYPGGRVKKTESSRKRVVRIKEFYPNGALKVVQTKNKRVTYFNNGLTNVSYAWKHKTDRLVNWKEFTVCKTVYTVNGHILRKTVYEEWNDANPQLDTSITRSNWIISDEKFERGKTTFSVKDMETKEYLKKYPDELGN